MLYGVINLSSFVLLSLLFFQAIFDLRILLSKMVDWNVVTFYRIFILDYVFVFAATGYLF